MTSTSLDYAFLKYFGVTADLEANFHRFYLPYLADCQRVLDLGSGQGGFVKLLCDAGKDAYGVDSDPGCIAEARSLGVTVVEADVVAHLREIPAGSLDAIFSAHLVEHLPYAVVMEVIELAHAALRPGGRLLLVTPNPRAMVSHLELYHQHFGHVAFYQPELLAFFMNYTGFSHTQVGENPTTAPDRTMPHTALGKMTPPAPVADPGPLRLRHVLPRPRNPLRQMLWAAKISILHWLVHPFIDHLADRDRTLSAQLQQQSELLGHLVALNNRAFECFAIGDKA